MTISIKPTASGSTIEQDGSTILTIDASDNVTVANDLTVSGTVSSTGDVAFDTDTLYVDATNNNVGIGTTTPSTGYGGAISNVKLALKGQGAGGNNGTATLLMGGDNNHYSYLSSEHTGGGATYLSFGTAGGAINPAERMRIDSSGNVMMGTTTRSNNEKVTIYQSVAQAMGLSVRTSGGPALGNYESSDQTHATYWTFGRDNQTTGNYVFASGGTLRGSISSTTGTYTAISDSRLKKNITNITYGLNEVMAFRPVTYLMNEEDDTAKKHLGFIAQEVKTLVDEAVDDLIDPDTQFYMLDKGGLVPVLVKAIQEQQAIIETLTTRIQALENQ